MVHRISLPQVWGDSPSDFFSENDWGWKRSTDFHSDVNNRTARSESEGRTWVHRKPDKRKCLSEFVKRDKHNRDINGAGFSPVGDVTQHLYSYKYTCKGIAYCSRDQTKEHESLQLVMSDSVIFSSSGAMSHPIVVDRVTPSRFRKRGWESKREDLNVFNVSHRPVWITVMFYSWGSV